MVNLKTKKRLITNCSVIEKSEIREKEKIDVRMNNTIKTCQYGASSKNKSIVFFMM
jgi:hypothetical protein